MKAKKFTLLILLVVLTLLVAACGAGGGGGGGGAAAITAPPEGPLVAEGQREVVRIAWLGFHPEDRIDPISGITIRGSWEFIELIESVHPYVELQIIEIPGDGWIQNMQTTILAGEADIGWYTNQIAATQWFVDHREFMAHDPDFSEAVFHNTFTDGAIRWVEYRSFDFPDSTGNIYGLPMDVTADLIVVDSVILEQWGVELPNLYPTYAELLDIARRTTGTNPVTGEHNFGVFLRPFWSEWHALGMDVFPTLYMPGMDLRELDMNRYVHFLETCQVTYDFFQYMLDFIELAPPGITVDAGAENWFTPENNIAVMIDVSRTRDWIRYDLADMTEITERFIPVFMPRSPSGYSGFPESRSLAVTRYANNPWLAWEVLKTITTNTDSLNWIFTHREMGALPALRDPSGLRILENDFNRTRWEDRLTGMNGTHDYWYWREPMQRLFADLFIGELTAAEARQVMHDTTVEWIENRIRLLG